MCPGSIYIDIIYEASKVLCSSDSLHNFCNEIYTKIYKFSEEKFVVYINEENYSINKEIKADVIITVSASDKENDSYWYDDMEIERRN